MPQKPDQPDAKETVEARLCAYLEGDLTGDERAQIERHLAGNAQHRKLLEELAGVRTWTRQLPREPAPPDLAEAFEQQVERAMLLDPAAGDRPLGRVGPRRWAVAAVLLLAAGAAALAGVLLHGGPDRHPVAVNAPTTRPDPAVPILKGGLTTVSPPVEVLGSAPEPVPATSPEPSVSDRLAAAGFRRPDANPVVALVVAGPPSPAAVGRAVGYFRDNRLAFDGPPAGGGAKAGFDAGAAANGGGQQQALPTPGAQSIGRPQPSLQQQSGAQSNNDGYGNNDPNTNRGNGPDKSDQNNALRKNATTNSAPAAPDPAGGDRLLVVRDVPPDQVGRLTSALSADGATVSRTDLPAAIAAGEQLDVTIPQLIGPGVEPTTVVRVADDGSVALPMLADPVPAAGLTPAELQQRIADRYRSANLISAAVVTVAPHGPATRPATTNPAARVTVVVEFRPPPTTRP